MIWSKLLVESIQICNWLCWTGDIRRRVKLLLPLSNILATSTQIKLFHFNFLIQICLSTDHFYDVKHFIDTNLYIWKLIGRFLNILRVWIHHGLDFLASFIGFVSNMYKTKKINVKVWLEYPVGLLQISKTCTL